MSREKVLDPDLLQRCLEPLAMIDRRPGVASGSESVFWWFDHARNLPFCPTALLPYLSKDFPIDPLSYSLMIFIQ